MKLSGAALTTGILAGMLVVTGCGFRPIYATSPDGAPPLNQLVAVRQVAAPETIRTLITDALNDRIILKDGEKPKYDLYVNAKESAERLAVQIDATVTRYNYRLRANYVLINLESGKRSSGSAHAVTSYNIVSSQYSTLYAERTAQEKASRLLAEEIERDLLIQFSDETSVADTSGEEETEPDSVLPDEPEPSPWIDTEK